ncbi:MAG: hypothetical protein LBN95_09535 [Prevotellaceae bacterium]|nr:hypothetical protein [Prevotellaceae bacterium]
MSFTVYYFYIDVRLYAFIALVMTAAHIVYLIVSHETHYSAILKQIPIYVIIISLAEYPYLVLFWKAHLNTVFIWYLLPVGLINFFSIKSTLRWVSYYFVVICSVFVVSPLISDKYVAKLSSSQIDIINIITFTFAVLYLCYFLYYLDKINKIKRKILKEETMETIYELQNTMLATTLALSQKQKILDNLETKTLDSKTKIMLREEKETDKQMEDFKEIVAKVHPDFFKNLEQKSGEHRLTALDVKYCVYIYMGFSNRDIANALHVEIESVKGKKRRIKQKLNLTASENLDKFIRKIANS